MHEELVKAIPDWFHLQPTHSILFLGEISKCNFINFFSQVLKRVNLMLVITHIHAPD
jgi:hypothetical protein